MPRIFINYRRDDSKSEARLLYHALEDRFPRDEIVFDIDTIPPGVDIREYLDGAVSACDVFIALVGPKWQELGDINDSRDWVRIEIESALRQQKAILPIAVNGGRLPSEDALPDALKPFAYKNALPLDTGRDFGFHVTRVIRWIERIGDHRAADSPDESPDHAAVPGRSEAGQHPKRVEASEAREAQGEPARRAGWRWRINKPTLMTLLVVALVTGFFVAGPLGGLAAFAITALAAHWAGNRPGVGAYVVAGLIGTGLILVAALVIGVA